MKVTTISAAIRYSKEIGNGAWKSLEIGAEATVEPREDWHDAEARLYAELSTELRTLWTGTNSNTAKNGEDTSGNGEQQPREHWCEEHQCSRGVTS